MISPSSEKGSRTNRHTVEQYPDLPHHTHSGPRLAGAISAGGARYTMRPGGPGIDRCLSQAFIDRCISAVKAWESCSRTHRHRADHGARTGRNRRRLLYGGLHPDPEVGLIKVENKPKTHGSLHLQVSSSARLEEHVSPKTAVLCHSDKKTFGDQVWAAFYQSCAGDIGWDTVRSVAVGVDMPVRDYWYADVKETRWQPPCVRPFRRQDRGNIDIAAAGHEYPLRRSISAAR